MQILYQHSSSECYSDNVKLIKSKNSSIRLQNSIHYTYIKTQTTLCLSEISQYNQFVSRKGNTEKQMTAIKHIINYHKVVCFELSPYL